MTQRCPFLLGPAALLALAALTSCSKPAPGAGAGAAAAPGTWEIAVIPKGTTHEYWKAIHAGALKAERELNDGGSHVHVVWKGPLREDDRDQQVQVVENFVGSHAAAIVLAPLDNRALVAPVEEAAEAHIPVVVIDSSLQTDKIASYVATDNRQGGRIAAKRLAELLGGKGNVILLRYAVGSASTEGREEGFLEAIKAFPGITLISADQHAGATRDTAKTVSENLLNRFGAQTQGIFASNESAASGMLLALRDAGLAGGKIKFVGFDSGEALNDGMAKGDIQGLVVQDPFKMGYLGVTTAVKVLKGEKVPATIDTGVGLVTPENMKDADKAALLHPPTHE
jgi:ribose transport system substrate-binding protein